MSTLELLKPQAVDELQKELRVDTLHELASLMTEQAFKRPNFDEPRPTKEDIFLPPATCFKFNK